MNDNWIMANSVVVVLLILVVQPFRTGRQLSKSSRKGHWADVSQKGKVLLREDKSENCAAGR